MVNIVTQKMTIEAVSDDLSCGEITRRLESVGIFASSLEVTPLNNRDEEKRPEFKRDPKRMTREDLERAGTRAAL